ncbi:MAG: gamma-glutamylcyclotransferase [Acetobacteraceae bacterium]|nr:gamma-glutamylcyclotransferase [Acetobacteraceae bacterium]
MLYFGYGSNLNAEDWEGFCRRRGFAGAEMRAVGTALLLDRELVFDRHSAARFGGALNLRERPGQAVEGVLFTVNEEALAALDRKEGAPHAYRRTPVHAIRPDGSVVEAMTYIAPAERHTPPHEDYVEVVRMGQLDHGLDPGQMEAAAAGETPALLIPWMFVYGTLREHQPNAHLLDGLPFRPASVPGLLFDNGPYPKMTLGEGRVRGEVVPLDPARLAALDALEAALPFGAPGGAYRRTVLPAVLDDGTATRVQLYVVEDVTGLPAIASGDWLSVGDRRDAWARHRATGGA